MDAATDPRRHVPRTDAVLADSRLVAATAVLGRDPVRDVVAAVQDQVRRDILDPADVADVVVRELPAAAAGHFGRWSGRAHVVQL